MIISRSFDYFFNVNRLIVVAMAKTSVNMPNTGWTFGYLVASQPAVRRDRIIGKMEIIRAIFSSIKTHLFVMI